MRKYVARVRAYARSAAPDFFALPSVAFRVPEPDGTGPTELTLGEDEPGELPAAGEDLAFLPVVALAKHLRRGDLAAAELAGLFLDRLRLYGPRLCCVVSAMEEGARRQAEAATAEIGAGRWRGWLHGVPWGIKDLFASADAPTTWGAERYRHQRFGLDAAVSERLSQAGAVCLAKLSTDELAIGSSGHWFGGMVRNPWNPELSAGGSSGGPASAVSAGLVPFSIGTETDVSVLGPATHCGVLGLRPTFGRISRFGLMPGVPSMDKVGLFCRHAADAAVVLASVHGADDRDPGTVEAPFGWRAGPLDGRRIGIDGAFQNRLGAADERRAAFVEALVRQGAELVPIELPSADPEGLDALRIIEWHYTHLYLRNREIDRPASRAGRRRWEAIGEAAKLFPAVEYLELSRIRSLLVQETAAMFRRHRIDLYLTSPFDLDAAGEPTPNPDCDRTNLTGLPALSIPVGLGPDRLPESVVAVARWWREDALIDAAHAWQQVDSFHRRRPAMFDPEETADEPAGSRPESRAPARAGPDAGRAR